jgi:hypothetical protein
MEESENNIPIAWFYIFILLFRWAIIGGSIIYFSDSSVSELIINSVSIFVVEGIILLGIRRSKKIIAYY